MEKGRVILVILLILFVGAAFPVDANLAISFNYGDKLFSLYNKLDEKFFVGIDVGVCYKLDNFTFLGEVSAFNDNIYKDPFSDLYYFGFYIFMKDARVSFSLQNSQISFGKTHLIDVIKTPYSLFISSNSYSRNMFEYKYDDGKFLYTTRWIQLSNLLNTVNQYEKYRSANYKVYATKFGGFRFGYQEVDVYVGKEFDFEYFANPIPGFFIQYLNAFGKPFSEGSGESNYIGGFFLDYQDNSKYLYAQILVDDANTNRILHPGDYSNPDKIAWSFGGSFNLE